MKGIVTTAIATLALLFCTQAVAKDKLIVWEDTGKAHGIEKAIKALADNKRVYCLQKLKLLIPKPTAFFIFTECTRSWPAKGVYLTARQTAAVR